MGVTQSDDTTFCFSGINLVLPPAIVTCNWSLVPPVVVSISGASPNLTIQRQKSRTRKLNLLPAHRLCSCRPCVILPNFSRQLWACMLKRSPLASRFFSFFAFSTTFCLLRVGWYRLLTCSKVLLGSILVVSILFLSGLCATLFEMLR